MMVRETTHRPERISNGYQKIFLDSDIEMQEALSWGFLLPQAYRINSENLPTATGNVCSSWGLRPLISVLSDDIIGAFLGQPLPPRCGPKQGPHDPDFYGAPTLIGVCQAPRRSSALRRNPLP